MRLPNEQMVGVIHGQGLSTHRFIDDDFFLPLFSVTPRRRRHGHEVNARWKQLANARGNLANVRCSKTDQIASGLR